MYKACAVHRGTAREERSVMRHRDDADCGDRITDDIAIEHCDV